MWQKHFGSLFSGTWCICIFVVWVNEYSTFSCFMNSGNRCLTGCGIFSHSWWNTCSKLPFMSYPFQLVSCQFVPRPRLKLFTHDQGLSSYLGWCIDTGTNWHGIRVDVVRTNNVEVILRWTIYEVDARYWTALYYTVGHEKRGSLYFYDPHCIFDHLMYCHVWYILG